MGFFRLDLCVILLLTNVIGCDIMDFRLAHELQRPCASRPKKITTSSCLDVVIVLLNDPLFKDCGMVSTGCLLKGLVDIYIPHRSAPCGGGTLSARLTAATRRLGFFPCLLPSPYVFIISDGGCFVNPFSVFFLFGARVKPSP